MPYNFQVIKGDTILIELIITDEKKKPFNLTGGTIKLFVAEKENPSNIIIEVTQNNHINPTGGVSSVEISSSDSKKLIEGKQYLFEIKFIRDDFVKTLCDGIFYIVKPLKEL